jgi:hypothetical protein
VRPADATVVTDARAHHCPICGRAVQTIQSFKCTECGRIDFCSNCVAPILSMGTQRFVCRACMAQKGWACSSCGGYALTVCISCRRRSCAEHVAEVFGLENARGSTVFFEYFSCPTCRGQFCRMCIQEKSGIFSTKYYCAQCSMQVQLLSAPSRACKFCTHTVEGTSSFFLVGKHSHREGVS